MKASRCLSSSSRPEDSRITVRFRLGIGPDAAASDVRDRMGRVRGRLPPEIDEPVIAKVEADTQAIIVVAFTSTRQRSIEISDYADRYVRDRLQNLPVVSEARIFGERRYAMRIWLDREFTVLARTGLSTPEAFRRVVVKDVAGLAMRLGSVARVEIGPEDERRVTRFNGDNAVFSGIVKQATANPLEVSRELRKLMPELVRDLPEGMNATIAQDRSIFICDVSTGCSPGRVWETGFATLQDLQEGPTE